MVCLDFRRVAPVTVISGPCLVLRFRPAFKDKIMAFWRWGEGSGKRSGSKFKTEQGSTTRVRLCRFFP